MQNAPQNNDYKAQLDALTIKVDKILEILNAATKNTQVEEEVKEASEPKTETIEPAPKKKRKSSKKSE